MMSDISPRHGLHQEAQKLRSTGRPVQLDRVAVPPASVFNVKSGAGDPSVWADNSPAAVRIVAHAMERNCEPSRTLVPQNATRRVPVWGARRQPRCLELGYCNMVLARWRVKQPSFTASLGSAPIALA